MAEDVVHYRVKDKNGNSTPVLVCGGKYYKSRVTSDSKAVTCGKCKG